MKTALFLSLVCAATIFGGCSSTNQGGTEDTYNSTPGSSYETEPELTEPSLPQGSGNAGTNIPPP